jgi:hypothetical protein
MPLIKIITDRQPWAAGSPHDNGAEIEVDAEEAAVLVANGFAEAVAAPRRRRAASEDEAAQ